MIVPGEPSSTRARIVALVVVVVLVVLGAWAAQRLRIVTDIRHFLPAGDDRALSDISNALADSSLTRTSVLAVEGPRAPQSAQRLATELRAHPEVEWVRSGIDAAFEEGLREVYLPRRVYLTRPDLSELGLARAAAELERALAGPKGALVRALAPADPLLMFTGFLDEVRREDGGALSSQDGQLVTADGSAAVLFVRTRSSAFASEPQARLQADLAVMMHAIRSEVDPQATLSQSGIARFAIAAERSTIADVTRVSIASTIAILALFLVLFGQARAVVLAYLPVVVGVGGGFLACSLLVDEVHGITIAFGSALLGVGIDYAVHLMLYLGQRGTTPIAQVVRRVWPGLFLGAATTVVGLAGLALTSFPGMRELALFGSVGIAGSLWVTMLLVPAFGARLPRRRARQWLIDRARGILDRVERWGARTWLLFAAIALFGLTGLVPLRWSDGLRALYQVDPMLLAEDTRVRDLTGAVDQSRMVLARGRDLDEALERNQIVHEAVDRAKQRGELAGYRSVQPWLPAASWQRENRQRLLEPGVAERFDFAFAAAGFRPGVFQAFFDDLAEAPAPLVLSDLRDTPLAPLVDPFVVELADGVVVVTWLRGDAPPSLRGELGNVPGVELFDQQAFLAGAYASYRVEMIRMLVLGLAAVLVIIFLRYRRWRPTAAAFLPALAGVLGVLGVVGWIEGTANLMHAASLLLVCSMGVDYGVFMVESRADGEHDAVTLAASILACATTVLSFGALGMSSNPALASVGTSVAVGVLCALLTTPVIAALPGARVR